MSYGSRNIIQDLKYEMTYGSIISKLIFVNVSVFLSVNIFYVISVLTIEDRSVANQQLDQVLSFLMLPLSLEKLMYKPWTLITHIFTHFKLFHLLFNMLWLYWFGKIVEDFLGKHRILPLYILGGLFGAILLIASYHIFPGLRNDLNFIQALGASAGVLAIIVAAATLVPDYTVFLLFLGPVKIKWIAVFLVVVDLISIPHQNTGGHIAHLGGALFGFIFIKQMQLGTDISLPFVKGYQAIASLFTTKKTMKPVYKRTTVPPKSNTRKKIIEQQREMDKQEKIDAILDKISQSGYDSLSQEEKSFLFRVSNEKD